MESLRDKLRSKTVGAISQFREESVSIDGAVIVVRQPTVEERGLIMDSAASLDEKTKKVKVDTARLYVNAVIALSCVPGDDGKASAEKVFEEADRERLFKQPAGGWFDELSKATQRQLNVDLDDAKND